MQGSKCDPDACELCYGAEGCDDQCTRNPDDCLKCDGEGGCICDAEIESVSVSKEYVCVNEDVTFTADVDSRCDCVEWSGGGDPATASGSCTFTTKWATAGVKSVSATSPCSSGGESVTVVAVDLDINGVDDPNEEDPGGFVGVNNDDDNNNDIADKDDTGTVTGEDDLVAITLGISPALSEGIVTLTATAGGAKIKVWESATKGTQVVLPKTWNLASVSLPGTLYVEGIAASDSERDIGLELAYDGVCGDEVRFTCVEVDLSIYNGRGGAMVAEEDETYEGAYLLVNWDDDDDDDGPDMNETGTVDDEDDLARIDFYCSTASTGTLELVKTGSNIKIWQNETKGTEQTDLSWDLATELPPSTLWVEGRSASSAERDVQLELKYIYSGNVVTSDAVKATVVMINLGNAVYRQLASSGGGAIDVNRGHGALVTAYIGACTKDDLTDADKFQITEMQKDEDGALITTLSTITNHATANAFGCYTKSGLSYAHRLSILKVASLILGKTNPKIGYVGEDAIEPDDWNDTISGIGALRCDGFVEVCYEINGFEVWGKTVSGSTHYDIKNNSYEDEHNDFYWIPYFDDEDDWADTLMPATQCGHTTPVAADTTFVQQNLCTPVGHTGE